MQTVKFSEVELLNLNLVHQEKKKVDRVRIVITLLCMVVFAFGGLCDVYAEDSDGGLIEDVSIETPIEKFDETVDDSEDEVETKMVGWLELSGRLRSGPLPYAWVSQADAGKTLEQVCQQLRTVRDDDKYLGVVIFVDYPMISFDQVQSLIKEIESVKKAGKRVIAFSEMYSTKGYLLATSADTIVLQDKGMVAFSGVAIEEMYMAGLLEKIGVKAELIQVGKYKGANEQMTREEPSEAWNENIDALLDDLHGQMVEQVAKGRRLGQDKVEDVIGRCWTMNDKQMLDAKIVDCVTSRDLIEVTQDAFGNEFQWDKVMGVKDQTRPGMGAGGNPMMVLQSLFKPRSNVTMRDTIAVVHCNGAIYSGYSTIDDGMFSESRIGSKTIGKILAKLKADSNVKGAILRIDSPGGSALASEVMWQAIRELGEVKPVYVSIGGMAASGGYYMACAGDEIFVSPSTVVGSIGVVGGKMAYGGLYDWAGVKVVRRSRGRYGDMFNSVEPFSGEQRKLVRASMKNTYELFKDRVRKGRGDRLEDLDAVDEGMLFTGREAVKNGMADKGWELAGYDCCNAGNIGA